MLLTDREWGEFYISGDKGLFELNATSSGIDKNKLNLKKGNIPYITRTNFCNGIDMFISDDQNIKYQKDVSNVISIGLDTQTVFYQPFSFFTGQNIQVLDSPFLNKYNAQFINILLKMQLKKLNWGGNGATLGRLKKIKILLPMNDKNQPDYDFMETFVKGREIIKKQEYSVYVKKIVANLSYVKIPSLEEKKWEAFFLIDVFTEIQRGKRLIKANQTEGKIPYISSSALNNGVDNFICNNRKVRKFANCISIANSGSVGASFFEPFEFVASDHVTHLKNDKFNKYIYLFITTITNRLSGKYNFNREINDSRISREKIMLPINKSNTPDYDYMEQYTKNMMLDKYNQYTNYLSDIRSKSEK